MYVHIFLHMTAETVQNNNVVYTKTCDRQLSPKAKSKKR